MTTFEIAHINEQGVNVVVVFVDDSVAHKTPAEQTGPAIIAPSSLSPEPR